LIESRCIKLLGGIPLSFLSAAGSTPLGSRAEGEHYLPDLSRRADDEDYEADPEQSDAARAHTGNVRRALGLLGDFLNEKHSQIELRAFNGIVDVGFVGRTSQHLLSGLGPE
jgi:hypothetical protein